jgi:diguanylate cyclase (GGDEF)-like protein
MRPVGLQKAYLLAGWAIAIAAVLLGGLLLKLNLDAYARDHADTQELKRFHLALVATNAVVAERGNSNSYMGASPDTARPLWAALRAKRDETDQAIAALNDSFEREFSLPAQGSLSDEARQRLHDARLAVDAAAARHLSNPGDPTGRGAIEKMFGAADLIEALRDDLGRNIIRSHPQIGPEILFISASSTMRDEAGRLGSYVVMALLTNGPPGRDLKQKMANVRGRLAELRSLTWSYGGVLLDDPTIAPALVEVDRDFFTDALLFAQNVEQKEEKADTGISTEEFTNRYTAGIKPVDALRELITNISRNLVKDSEAHALQTLIVVGALIAAICLVLGLTGVFLHRMLFLPLMLARQQLVAIAEGNLSEPSVPLRGSREVQDLFRGLSKLREELRAKKALERSQERMAARLKRLSETDPLTGLLNRRTLSSVGRRVLKDAARSGKWVVLILFDIDHFKRINDAHGHSVGDDVLKAVVQAIQFRLRIHDYFVRYGGEEFVVLAQADHEDEGRLMAERFRACLRYLHIQGLPDLAVTASFGVATSKAGADALEVLIAEADRRLYVAKESGRNRVSAAGSGSKPLLQRAS